MSKFTKEQLEKLQSSIKIGKCPNCGNTEQHVLDAAFHLISIDGANGLVSSEKGTEFLPLAAVVCDNCSHTSFFSLLDLGVFEK